MSVGDILRVIAGMALVLSGAALALASRVPMASAPEDPAAAAGYVERHRRLQRLMGLAIIVLGLTDALPILIHL